MRLPQRNLVRSNLLHPPCFLAATLSITASLVGAIAPTLPSAAQIVPDGSLGGDRSRVTPGVTIRGGPADRIDGGALRGSSLFHSFEQFNVNNHQRVYFSNPAGIETIFSRVTGTDVSDILGTLGVDGHADLFLLNPNGIVFGPDAQLDIAGSFVASTGDRFTFADGSSFSATDPQAPPLLLVNVPVGVQYGVPTTGTITNRGTLVTGNDLTLAASNLNLEGQLWAGGDLRLDASNRLMIRDRVDAPFIAASHGQMGLRGAQSVDIFALNHADSGLFAGGDLVLQSATPIGGDAHYWSGGSVRFETLDGSAGVLESPYDPVIRAAGDVQFDSYTGASLHILAGGSVIIPNGITITGVEAVGNSLQEVVTLPNGQAIAIDGSAVPTVDIRAGTTAVGLPSIIPNAPPGFVPGAPNVNAAATGATIRVGTITNLSGGATNSGTVLLTNLYSPNGSTAGDIQTGDINTFGDVAIAGRGTITVNGFIDTRTTVNDQIAGDVTILAPNGDVTVTGNIFSNVGTLDPNNIDLRPTITGVGGDITIAALGDIRTRNVIATSNNSTLADFSTIRLESSQGSVFLDNVRVSARNYGDGQFAGDIFVDAGDRIEITNSSQLSADGNLGRIFVGTRSSDLTADPSAPRVIQISNSRLSTTNQLFDGATPITLTGDTGGITLRGESVSLLDEAFLTTNTYSGGSAGSVTVQAQELSLTGGSEILSQTFGAGNGGDITVDPLNAARPSSVTISGVARLTDLNNDGIPDLDANGNPTGGFSSGLFATTEAGATGNGGFITVNTDRLQIADGGVISARSRSVGNSNDIRVNVGRLEITGGGQILTAAYGEDGSGPGGAAGDIVVTATEQIQISGYDATFNARFQGLINAFVAAGQDPATAFRLAQRTVDPVSPNSGLQAPDVFGYGAAGAIAMTAPTVALSDLAIINASTRSDAPGGNITVRSQALSLTGGAEILTLSAPPSFLDQIPQGRAGDIIIEPLDPNRPSSVLISGMAPVVLPDGSVGGFSSGLFASTERAFQNGTLVFSNGVGGDIRLTTSDLTISNGGAIGVRSRSTGAGGNALINVDTLAMTGGGQIISAALGTGPAGNIVINATGRVGISGSDPTYSDRLNQVAALLRSQDPTLTPEQAFDNARSVVDLLGSNNDSAQLPVIARSGLQARSEFENGPRSGDIFLTAGSIFLNDGAEINSERNNADLTTTSTIRLVANRGSVGLDNSRIFTTNLGSGFAGGIGIAARDRIAIGNGSRVISEGNFGRIFFGDNDPATTVPNPRAIRVSGGSWVRADNADAQSLGGASSEQAGFVNMTAFDRILITGENTRVSSDTFQDAPAGQVRLFARQVNINNLAQVSSSTFGDNNAGNVLIVGSDRVTLANGSIIFSTVEAGAVGNAGFILVQTPRLLMDNGAQLQTLVRGPNPQRQLPAGQGDAGSVILDVSDTVSLTNSSTIFTSIGPEVIQGNGGSILIGNIDFPETGGSVRRIRPTRSLLLTGGSQLITDTAGAGNAGNLFVIARNFELAGSSGIFPSAVFSGVQPGSTGRGGTIALVGRITFNAQGGVQATRPAARLTIRDGARLTVSSFGSSEIGRGDPVLESTQRAGNIFVDASLIELENNGFITARTGEGDGGNINLRVNQLMSLRGGSRISTTAGLQRRPGAGGNIFIRARSRDGFIIADLNGNNDITADAFISQGGKVRVNTNVVGLLFRSREDLEALLGEETVRNQPDPAGLLETSDITAISQNSPTLNGEVRIEGAQLDTRGVVELPVNLVDATDQIGQVCPTGAGASDRLGVFVVTGRGGVSPTPLDLLSPEAIGAEWVGETAADADANAAAAANANAPANADYNRDRPSQATGMAGTTGQGSAVEADGWVVTADGQVQLVASAAAPTVRSLGNVNSATASSATTGPMEGCYAD